MNQNEAIKQALRGLKSKSGAITLIAEVTSIDDAETSATIQVDLGNGLFIEDVRLRSIIDNEKGAYIIPKLNSKVLLLRIGQSDEFTVVGFSAFEKVIIKGESVGLTIENDLLKFNDNSLNSFMPDINKLVSKINTIEGSINGLKAIFNSWVTVPNDGGAALKAAAATWAGQQITQTTKDSIKDPKILN